MDKCTELNCKACCTKELNFEIVTSPNQVRRIFTFLNQKKLPIPHPLVIVNTGKGDSYTDTKWGFKFWDNGELKSGKLTFQDVTKGHCIYYDKGCTVYPDRPLGCRLYRCEQLGGVRKARTREELRMLKEEEKFQRLIQKWNNNPGTLEQFFHYIGLHSLIYTKKDGN